MQLHADVPMLDLFRELDGSVFDGSFLLTSAIIRQIRKLQQSTDQFDTVSAKDAVLWGRDQGIIHKGVGSRYRIDLKKKPQWWLRREALQERSLKLATAAVTYQSNHPTTDLPRLHAQDITALATQIYERLRVYDMQEHAEYWQDLWRR